MPKIQLLLRGASLDHASFARRVDALAPALLAEEPEGLKLTVTEAPPPRLSVIPFSRTPFALLSVWTRDEGALDAWSRAAATEGIDVTAYRVEESTPVAYARTWPDGERTPAVVLLTVFRRKRGLDDEELIRRWHGGHTPLSLEIHPLFGYVRNVVTRSSGAPLDAIVEEHFRTREDLLHPHKMFGGPLRMLPNMVRVAKDIAGFIDRASLETFLAAERWIRTPGGTSTSS
ncbi:MAG: EthD domain-containing protein [Sandaracinaceae bacterium]|nr:EthD domain-containing protein [Sandaracinaceae bacterium]